MRYGTLTFFRELPYICTLFLQLIVHKLATMEELAFGQMFVAVKQDGQDIIAHHVSMCVYLCIIA